MELESDVELSELDKCRSSHSADSVGVFVELTIFNACSGVSGWNLLSSGAGVAGECFCWWSPWSGFSGCSLANFFKITFSKQNCVKPFGSRSGTMFHLD